MILETKVKTNNSWPHDPKKIEIWKFKHRLLFYQCLFAGDLVRTVDGSKYFLISSIRFWASQITYHEDKAKYYSRENHKIEFFINSNANRHTEYKPEDLILEKRHFVNWIKFFVLLITKKYQPNE